MGKHELTLFQGAALPAHIAAALEEGVGNIAERQSIPSLTYGGQTWTINLNGEAHIQEKTDSDGERVKAQVMRVIVLDYAKRRGRAYYEGTYDPANPGRPLCWSDDGKLPHASVSEPPHSKCDGCPMAEKGSRISDRAIATAACSQHRMLVVVPANAPDFTPLRLKIAITSDYDKKSPDQEAKGWFAFSQYMDLLASRNVKHTGLVVTKMKFDPKPDYPKVFFSAGDWVDAEAWNIVKDRYQEDAVKKLLNGDWSPEGADGTPTKPAAEDDDAPAALPKKPKPPAPPAPPPKVQKAPPPPPPKPKAKRIDPETGDEIEDPDPASDRRPAFKASDIPDAKPKSRAAAAADDDDGDDAPAPSTKPSTKPKAPTTAAPPANMDKLLGSWDNDE